MKYQIIASYLLFLSFTSSGQSDLNTITTAVPFILITPDARATGSGETGCASTPDVYSNHWNPAKNAFQSKRNGIAFSYTPWFTSLTKGMSVSDISWYRTIGKAGVIGFSAKYFRIGELTYTDIVGNTIGTYKPYEHMEAISYALKLTSNLSVGASIKHIYSDLAGDMVVNGVDIHPGQSVAMGLSCFKTDTINKNDIFSWGIDISNVGPKLSYRSNYMGDFLPANLRIGASYKWNFVEDHSVEFLFDMNKLLVPTPPTYVYDPFTGEYTIQAGKDPNRSVFNALYSSFYDAPGGFKEELHEIMLSGGMEYWCCNTVAARMGYFYEHDTKGGRKYLTFGLGGKYKSITLNGGYLIPQDPNSPLGHTWRLSLAFEFDGKSKRNQ